MSSPPREDRSRLRWHWWRRRRSREGTRGPPTWWIPRPARVAASRTSGLESSLPPPSSEQLAHRAETGHGDRQQDENQKQHRRPVLVPAAVGVVRTEGRDGQDR